MASEANERIGLTNNDKHNMRVFLKDLYQANPSIVDNWAMNDSVFEIVQEIIAEAGICSDNMEWVPQPTDLVGDMGIRSAKKILESIAKRVIKDRFTDRLAGSKTLDFRCKRSISRGYRSALEEAGMQ